VCTWTVARTDDTPDSITDTDHGLAGAGELCRTGSTSTPDQAWTAALTGALAVLAERDARGCAVTVANPVPITVLLTAGRTPAGQFDLPATQEAAERLLTAVAPRALGTGQG
jgi:hypothetical protein